MSEPLKISPEAKELAAQFVWPSGRTMTRGEAEQICQTTINSATEKLTKELEDYKYHVAGHPQTTAPHGQLAPSCEICNTAHDGISLLSKELEEARAVNADFDKTVAEVATFKANDGSVEELVRLRASRDILKTLYRAADEGMNLSCDAGVRKQFRDAVEAARKELYDQ